MEPFRRGKFYFYPTSALEQAFRDRTPAEAGLHATRIINDLVPDCLSATEALQKYRHGVRIGHTVVVMASVLQERQLSAPWNCVGSRSEFAHRTRGIEVRDQ